MEDVDKLVDVLHNRKSKRPPAAACRLEDQQRPSEEGHPRRLQDIEPAGPRLGRHAACPPLSAGLTARQRPPGPLKLGCPPLLHAQALALGPLAAVRLHRAVGSGTSRRWRQRCCQSGRTPAASRRLPGQRQRQAPPTATRPPSFGIPAESGVPLGVFQLSGPAVPASPKVRHPYPAPCDTALVSHGAGVTRSILGELLRSSPRIGRPSRSCVSATPAHASRSSVSFTCHRNTKPQPRTPPCAWR